MAAARALDERATPAVRVREQHVPSERQAAEANRELDAIVERPRFDAGLLGREDDATGLDARQLHVEGERLEPATAEVEQRRELIRRVRGEQLVGECCHLDHVPSRDRCAVSHARLYAETGRGRPPLAHSSRASPGSRSPTSLGVGAA